ncbi:AAA domain-containing protein [Mycena venus]|uniref:AAA domain-containing protein n=1 Tax=Mycena venus TaxID=2733690 RepID=A0A8H6U138_9AGAR|nr:AAA domain-containing protein [Mycena venus]
MRGPSKDISNSFIQRATVAAATLKQFSEIQSTPYLKVVAGVALLIFETVRSVKTNKEECAALVEQIYQIICAIIDLTAETSTSLSLVLLDAMAKFAETLQKIESFMRTQQDKGRLKRFLRQQENAALLEDCKLGLRHALDVFSIQTRAITIADVAEFQFATEHKHQELLKLIAESNLSDQGSSVLSTGSISSLGLHSSFSSLSLLLPSAPQIFHGRESELRDMVYGLMQDAARVAILCPGGIGKTSLAKAALHHPDVVDKYSARYFVSCDSAGTVEILAFAVASSLGLELTRNLPKAIIKHLSAQSSCLVILDNFETPWEPLESRSKVEDFLATLGDFPHVALLVTMRGQERPLKIRWTRPFLPPLKPLSSDAAQKTFMDIADADSDDDSARVAELLALTGNLPLAMTLMASVSAFDGCESVLTRWKTENVSLLSDGFDKETNLEASLRLSLSSPRMASSPGALHLLSLLALLPDGILDVDLFASSCPIPDLPRCKSTLMRTSLAYTDGERLKVLAPVRELIRKNHPPSYALVRPLRLHWDHLLRLWRTYQMPSGDLIRRLAGNSGNVNSLLQYGLDIGAQDLKEVVYEIFHLDGFTGRTYGEPSPLMADIASYVERADDNGLRGYYISHRFSDQPTSIAEAVGLIAQGSKFFQLAGDVRGESRFQNVVAKYYLRLGDVNKAATHADMSLSLADQADDNIRRNRALCMISTCRRLKGKFREALEYARRAQWVAGQIGRFDRETEAMEEEAMSWLALGNFSQAVDICRITRQLVIARGVEKTVHEITILDFEADIYLYKTAYPEARRAYECIVQYTSSVDKFALFHGNSRAAIAAIDVALGVFKSEDEVTAALEISRQIFTSRGYLRGLPICDKVMADFLIAQGRISEAVQMYQKCLHSLRGKSAESFSGCLQKLGDITLTHDARSATQWAITYLAYGRTTSNPSVVAWAFRLLGDIFREEADEKTSESLFQLALEEFTRMDIYQGRAQCLLRLGENAQKRGEHSRVKDYSSEARKMFFKSGITAEAQRIGLIE